MNQIKDNMYLREFKAYHLDSMSEQLTQICVNLAAIGYHKESSQIQSIASDLYARGQHITEEVNRIVKLN